MTIIKRDKDIMVKKTLLISKSFKVTSKSKLAPSFYLGCEHGFYHKII